MTSQKTLKTRKVEELNLDHRIHSLDHLVWSVKLTSQ